jgi:hypothetical protein
VTAALSRAQVPVQREFLVGDIDESMIQLTKKRLGWDVDENAKDEPLEMRYSLEDPDPKNWGLHPEDVRELCDTMRQNIPGDLFSAP